MTTEASTELVMRATRRWRPSRLIVTASGIVAVLSLPLVYLVMRALESGAEGFEYLLRPRTLTIFVNSLVLTVVVVVASGVIGITFAWLTTRTNTPFRRVLLVLGLLPMAIPSYIGSLTLVAAFGPVGYLQKLLEPLGVTRLPDIYGLFGAAFAITLFTYPYFALPVRAALLNLDTSLEEAAQSLGSSRWSIFWRVTLPVLRPSIAAGAILTAMYTLSDFGAVMVMRYNAFSRAIYVAYNSSFDRNRAALLALVLVACTLLLSWMERRAMDSIRTYRVGKGTSKRAPMLRSGLWHIPALVFLTILIGIGVILPVGTLVGWALNPAATSPIDMNMPQASWNAVSSSAITALVTAAAAVPLGLLARRSSSRFARTLVGLAYIGNALPGIVIGLALVFFGANAFPAIYQTLPLLVLGYAIRFLPYALASTRSALSGMSPALEEAGRSLGLTTVQVALRVTLPLMGTGIIAGMGLVFLNTMKELPTTLMLAPIGFQTPATRVWMASEAGQLALIGLPGLILIGLSCLGLVILLWRDERATD
ncbi:MAG: iron ABC transporter permease [Anaerolineae bacterium]|nr:iron ABC transporter permease [Anaerolineae bacterium]